MRKIAPGPPRREDAIVRVLPPQTASDRRSEFEHPTANALVGNVEPALGKQLLNIAIAQAEPEVQPDGMLDDDRRKAMPTIRERMHGVAAYGRSAALAKLS